MNKTGTENKDNKKTNSFESLTISKEQAKMFAELIYPSIVEFYEDPKNVLEYEEWLKTRNNK